jgi:ABC-type multidrug transport system fused ATPase/permease subunit
MEDGEIKEVGEHNLLMSADGGYGKLYTTQKNLEEGYTL